MHRAATTISPKVIASTCWTFLAGILAAIVLALVDHPEQLDGVDPGVRFVIIAALPAVSAALAGYRAKDPLRDLGAAQLDQTTPSGPGA